MPKSFKVPSRISEFSLTSSSIFLSSIGGGESKRSNEGIIYAGLGAGFDLGVVAVSTVKGFFTTGTSFNLGAIFSFSACGTGFGFTRGSNFGAGLIAGLLSFASSGLGLSGLFILNITFLRSISLKPFTSSVSVPLNKCFKKGKIRKSVASSNESPIREIAITKEPISPK